MIERESQKEAELKAENKKEDKFGSFLSCLWDYLHFPSMWYVVLYVVLKQDVNREVYGENLTTVYQGTSCADIMW